MSMVFSLGFNEEKSKNIIKYLNSKIEEGKKIDKKNVFSVEYSIWRESLIGFFCILFGNESTIIKSLKRTGVNDIDGMIGMLTGIVTAIDINTIKDKPKKEKSDVDYDPSGLRQS